MNEAGQGGVYWGLTARRKRKSKRDSFNLPGAAWWTPPSWERGSLPSSGLTCFPDVPQACWFVAREGPGMGKPGKTMALIPDSPGGGSEEGLSAW